MNDLEYELVLKEAFVAMPKASGGDRRSESFKIDSGVDFEKTKQQTIASLGFSQKEAERIQQLTPEAVREATEIARKTNDSPPNRFKLSLKTAQDGFNRVLVRDTPSP